LTTYAAEAVEAGQAAVADRSGTIECQIIMVQNWLVADWCRICVRAIHQHLSSKGERKGYHHCCLLGVQF
jgi:hypothetical protein